MKNLLLILFFCVGNLVQLDAHCGFKHHQRDKSSTFERKRNDRMFVKTSYKHQPSKSLFKRKYKSKGTEVSLAHLSRRSFRAMDFGIIHLSFQQNIYLTRAESVRHLRGPPAV